MGGLFVMVCFFAGGGIVVLVLIFLLKGCVPVMGISVSDFVTGGFIVTTESADNSYGLYEVVWTDGAGCAELVREINGERQRCVMRVCPSGSVTDERPGSFVMHRAVVWGQFSGGVSCEPLVYVDVVRVFAADECEAAVEYFNALIEARKVLGKLRSGATIAPLNIDLSKPHVLDSGTVDSVVGTLVDRELAGLVGFEAECGKLLAEVNFGSSDKEAVDALMAREAAVPSRAHSRYYLLANDEVGVYSLGFFMGDLVRVETCDGVQFLQVISGGNDVVAVSNITDGSHCTLKIVSELDEDWYDDEEEHYDTYLHLVKPDGSDNRVYVNSFMILPITNRVAVGEFESIREAQGVLLKKFSDGIMERLIGFNETMHHRPDSFVVGITYSEQIELLEDINSLNCDAMWSGDIERLQTLEKQVRTLIESKLESVREAVHDLCSEVSEALVKVAALNAK